MPGILLPVVIFMPTNIKVDIIGNTLNCEQTYPDAPVGVLNDALSKVKEMFPTATGAVEATTKKVSFTVTADRKKMLLFASQLFGMTLLSES